MKYIYKPILIGFALMGSMVSYSQQKQIPRIDLMPDKPSPYMMYDWQKITQDYDSFVFDTSKTGQHLPLTTISENDGTNYPSVKGIFMSTYVGQDSKSTAEAINILPSLVGASLVGVDKSNQNNVNWVDKIKDFYNKRNGQNVYLNNYSTVTGNDWWYELMPNVYFYQLYSLYPNKVAEFTEQFTSVADRQLDVVYKLGGSVHPWAYPNMNHRAFNLETGQPKTDGVKEPEAAGAIGWILYQAYKETGNENYKLGAELSLDFLQNTTDNPSYELQLPYGIQVASKMNALENTNYDIEKFLNWIFSDGKNTLRGWGTIVGNWGGYDVSGLVGEAKDAGNDYAFVMNGFQHAGALAPVAKYDKRYAKALGKWILNLSNASRYFYPGGLPSANQDAISLSWSTANDAKSAIPYESLKETSSGKTPYAMGDALGGAWAPTNLSLYSGSSVGYLGAIVATTNVEGILQIDLNKTDFGIDSSLKNYLYFNPNSQDENVTLTLPSGSYSIYDAITETDLKTNVSGSVTITIPQKDVRSIVIYPAGSTKTQSGKLLKLSNGEILDYHYQWNFNPELRLKALYSAKNEVVDGETLEFIALAENAQAITYEWFVNGTKQSETSSKFTWVAPLPIGDYAIKCIAKSGSQQVENSKTIKVLSSSVVKPEIKGVFLSGNNPYAIESVIDLNAETNQTEGFVWTVSGGRLQGENTTTPKWTLPDTEGIYTIELKLSNSLGEAVFSKDVLVKNTNSQQVFSPIIYYPLDGDTKNAEQDKFNATSVEAVLTSDSQSEIDRAYRFENNKQYLYTENDPALNFSDQMTLSFWIKPEKLGEGEQYVISHGSWEERFKVSLAPEGKLIFTLKTSSSIIDIDDPKPLVNNEYVHFTMLYTGYSVEVYRNGELVNFKKQTGAITPTSKNLTVVRKDMTTSDYTFKGAIDEIRLYDKALNIAEIKELPVLFQDIVANNVEVKNLFVDGVKWDIRDKFILDCSSIANNVSVEVETYAGATTSKSNSIVDASLAGIINFDFTIKANDGTAEKTHTLKIERPFKFDDIIEQKWNKVLTVNNNSSLNGGFSFKTYRWFKDGQEIGNRQYYSAGNNDEVLDVNALYSAELTTDNGDIIHVCPFNIKLQSSIYASVYPRIVSVGDPITLEVQLEADELNDAQAKLFSNRGILISTIEVESNKNTFKIDNSGLHVLQFTTKNGFKKSFKILVK